MPGNSTLFDELELGSNPFSDDLFYDASYDGFEDGDNNEQLQEVVVDMDKWVDVPPTMNNTCFAIDECQQIAWRDALDEAKNINISMRHLRNKKKDEEITDHDIISLFFCPKTSKLGPILLNAIGLSDEDEEKYYQFLSCLCLQAAYRISTKEAYHKLSAVGSKISISENEYVRLWYHLSTCKKVNYQEDGTYLTASRRDTCIWESMQQAFNDTCRSISVLNRRGQIRLALDDDKFWFAHEGVNAEDNFGLNHLTFTKANRKGICGHTAVTASLNIPLGIELERKGDSSTGCFKRLLDQLFPAHERQLTCDLRHVSIFSDRGYLDPTLVWGYLLKSGADVLGTIKRAASWPFTYQQNLGRNDKRTLLSTKGAPTLWMKLQTRANVFKSLAAFAFRSGTDNVSMAISSMHHRHQWEGVALFPQEIELSPMDRREKAISRVWGKEECESLEEKMKIEDLLTFKVIVFTVNMLTSILRAVLIASFLG